MPQESRPLNAGNATTAQIIQEARHTGILIRDLPPGTEEEPYPEPIKQSLRYCMLLVGIRAQNMPDEEEKGVLIDFIREHYSGHTSLEIKIAFDMAVSGQLDIDDVKCYENFSCEYLARIMSAYRKKAAVEVKQIKMPENDEKEPNKVISITGSVDWSKEWSELLNSAKNGTIYKTFIPLYLYDWILKQEDKQGNVKFYFDAQDKWESICKVARQYMLEMEAALLNGYPTNEGPYESRQLVDFIKAAFMNYEGAKDIGRHLQTNTRLWGTLLTLSKQQLIREAAIAEAVNSYDNEKS